MLYVSLVPADQFDTPLKAFTVELWLPETKRLEVDEWLENGLPTNLN